MISTSHAAPGFRCRQRVLWILLLLVTLAAAGAAQVGGSSELDDPDAEIDPRFERARQFNREGEFEKAWAIYDEILADRGLDVPTLVTYGNMKWRAGDLKAAEEKLKLAVATMPTHIKAQQFLGQLYFFQGRRKLARERFEHMRTLKFMREDVLHSALLNLGKMELLDEKWRSARRLFRILRRDGGKADRKSGERGNRLIREMLEMDEWPRYDSVHLHIHFSKNLKQFVKIESRRRYASELDQWIEKVVRFLGIEMPDPWHLYVFEDDAEASFMTGREQAHGWDYSWWLSYSAVDSPFSVKHTLAVQLCSRWGTPRPMSRSLVEGFCHYLADEGKDPYQYATVLYRQGRLPTILKLHEHQRRDAQYMAGIAYVDYMIRTCGIEKFRRFWRRFNIEVNLRKYKINNYKKINFKKAFDVLYPKTLGVSFEAFEQGWRGEVIRRAGEDGE